REPTVDDYLPRFTWDEYVRIENPPGLRIEFEDGRLLVSPAGRNAHNFLRDILAYLLERYEERHPSRCLVIEESSFFMPPRKRDYQPDVAVVVDDRPIDPHGWMQGAPDIAIEVLSPSTRRRDLGLKARRYFEQGSDEYWLFDAELREARFLRRGVRDWVEAPP